MTYENCHSALPEVRQNISSVASVVDDELLEVGHVVTDSRDLESAPSGSESVRYHSGSPILFQRTNLEKGLNVPTYAERIRSKPIEEKSFSFIRSTSMVDTEHRQKRNSEQPHLKDEKADVFSLCVMEPRSRMSETKRRTLRKNTHAHDSWPIQSLYATGRH